MSHRFWILCAVIAVMACVHPDAAFATLRVHPLFSSGMVLQRDARVPVWGTAAEGDVVTVHVQGRAQSVTARDGKWMVYFESLEAGGPYEMKVSAGDRSIVFTDVLVGDVWICAGESNMEWSLLAAHEGARIAAEARLSRVRLFNVGKALSIMPRSEVTGEWQSVAPETARDFSAVGYFFGRALQQSIDVPVGLIQVTWAGTRALAWTSRSSLAASPAFRELALQQDRAVQEYLDSLDLLVAELTRFRKATAEAFAEGREVPELPSFHPFLSPALRPGSPANLYNGMIAPLIPFRVRGVLLYQGESDVPRYREYPLALTTLIDDWRRAWAHDRLPFVIIQLAPYGRVQDEPVDSRWAELRDAQLRVTQAVPDTALVVTTDAGTPGTVNPIDKEPVGVRAALAARALTCGQRLVASGPVVAGVRAKGSTIVLDFDHVGSGLTARENRLTGFDVAGEDGRFVRAKAEIHGNSVAVWSPVIEKPIVVRYAWADYPEGTLMNREGLPASPFRVQ